MRQNTVPIHCFGLYCATLLLWLCLLVAGTPRTVQADPVFNPANGHYYERVNVSGLSWQQAEMEAENRTYLGIKGHLVTITSTAENEFVFSLGNVVAYHFGAYQDTSAPNFSEPAGGWRWVTEEAFTYTNWAAGEPNNGRSIPGNAENYMVGWSGSSWNDGGGKNERGYVVEYDHVVWGARVIVNKTDGAILRDYLVAANQTSITLQSGLEIQPDTGEALVQQTLPLSEIQSIVFLANDPVPGDGGPGGRGFNRYVRPGNRSPQLNGYSRGNGWTFTYYTYTKPRYYQNLETASSLTLYAIPRCPGTNDYAAVYNELTAACLSATLTKLGLSLPRLIPLQVLYAIAWREGEWKHFGQITVYTDEVKYKSHAKSVPDPGGDLRTLVTIDGGIGMLQTTNDANINSAPPGVSPLTHLYRMASDREYQIQVGAYHLANASWNSSWNTYPNDRSPEFLEHWYWPVAGYNNAESYAKEIWNFIKTAPYKKKLPAGLQNAPQVQPLKLTKDQPQNADWNLNGAIDLLLTDLKMAAAPGGVTVSVLLTPQGGYPAPTKVSVTIQNRGSSTLTAGTGHTWSGMVSGTFGTPPKKTYVLFLDITASGQTKRAVCALKY